MLQLLYIKDFLGKTVEIFLTKAFANNYDYEQNFYFFGGYSMKKLSKILVIVLTLAMLLGVVVISASANDATGITYVSGNKTAQYTAEQLPLAIADANADESDVVITLNENVTLTSTDVMEITKTKGKLTLDLNGKTLDCSAVVSTFDVYLTHAGTNSGYVSNTYCVAKVRPDSDSAYELYYINDHLGNALAIEGVSEIVDGGEYTGAVTSGTKVYKITGFRGVFNIAENANLNVDGNGGSIFGSTDLKNCIFYTDYDAEGANLSVKDLYIEKSLRTNTPVAYVNNGSMTFENCEVYALNNGYMFNHSGDAELNIKDSYFHRKPGRGLGNSGFIKMAANTKNDAADGYHIEVENSMIITNGNILSTIFDDSSFRDNGPNTTAPKAYKKYGSPLDTRLSGETYVNTSVKLQNCNIESALAATNDDYYNRLIYGSILDYDFIGCNIFVGSKLVQGSWDHYFGGGGVVNFRDCYIEMTGKIHANYTTHADYTTTVVSKLNNAQATVNMYGTELVIREGTSTSALFDSASAGRFNLYQRTVFDATATTAVAKNYTLPNGCTANTVNGKLFITGADVGDGAEVMVNQGYNGIEVGFTTTGGVPHARNPISILSEGKIRADGLIDPRGNNNLRDNNRTGYNLTGSGIASIIDCQGNVSIQTEADGNNYFMYDPTTVYFGAVYNKEIAADDSKGFAAIDASATKAIDTAHPGYVAADAAGVLKWNIADGKAVFAADGAYEYTHINDTDTVIAGWDIDLDGFMEYIAIKEADGNLLPDYVNTATTAETYKMTEIPDAYTTICDRMQINMGYVSGFEFSNGYTVASLSFDIKNPEGADFLSMNITAYGRGSSDSIVYNVSIKNGKLTAKADNLYLPGADGKLVKQSAAISKELDYDVWNNISVIIKVEDVNKDTGVGAIYTYWFLDGEYCFTTKDDGGAATKLNGTILRANVTGFGADDRLCIDNLTSVQYENYQNDDLDALLTGKETNINSWADSATAIRARTVDDISEKKVQASVSWNTFDGTVSTVPYSSLEEAITHANFATLKLEETLENYEVKAPFTVALADGVDFTYYSDKYIGTVNGDGSISFALTTNPDDFATVTENYDGETETVRTYTKGSTVYLDYSKIPAIRSGFVPARAEKYSLTHNGTPITDEYIASLGDEKVTLDGDVAFIVTKVVDFSYDWAIYTPEGELLYEVIDGEIVSDDMGNGWSTLVARINEIEAYFDPLANGDDVIDIVDGAPISSLVSDIVHTHNGYKVVLFNDFLNVQKPIQINTQATGRTVTIDLNGHTVKNTKRLSYIFRLQTAIRCWEYVDGKVIAVYDESTDQEGVEYVSGYPVRQDDASNTYYAGGVAASNTLNIISSQPGAKILADSTYVTYMHGAGSWYLYNSDKKTYDTHSSAYQNINVGTLTSDDEIGHDANAIYIEADGLSYTFKSTNQATYSNVNAKTFSNYPLYASGGHLFVKGSTVTAQNLTTGMIGGSTSAKRVEVSNSNLISETPANLYAYAFLNDNNYDTCVLNSRIINMYLKAKTQNYKSSVKVKAVYVGKGCYYTLPYDAESANSVYLNDSRLAENAYTANVYVNEKVTINGVDYLLKYQVTSGDTAEITWTDASGNQIGDIDTYLIGATAISHRDVEDNDVISNKTYQWAADYGKVTGNDTFAALDDGVITPKFSASNTLALYSELLYNFMIEKSVGGVDVKDYITTITLGGEVVYNASNGDANKTFKDVGNYYGISVRVKSNEIADDLVFVVNYNTVEDGECSVTYTVSVLKYLSYGLNYEAVGSDLHNLYISLGYYGIESAKEFGATEGAVEKIEAVVGDYSAPAAIEEGEAGKLAGGLGMALVLDDRLTYRIYVDDNAKWLNISYTALVKDGDAYVAEVKTVEADKYGNDAEGYYYDLNLSAYDFIGGITVTLMNGETERATVEDYTINDYYADLVVAGKTESTPPALLAAVRAYAFYANAYITSIG